MSRPILVRGAIAPALALAVVVAASDAHAATADDLAAIRAEIRQLKQTYEARIDALEMRLRSAEADAAKARELAATPAAASATAAAAAAPPATSAAPVAASEPAAGAPAAGIAAFNPAISAVLQGRYANLSQDPQQYRIAGFAPGGDIGPGRRGLSLGESEFALSANVDDKFYGNLIVSLTPENTLAVEEAYGLYNAAPYGLAPKFGRFFSGIGYQNEQHQHAWDFIDAPLAYEAFLGGQFAQDGLQVKWVAPVDQFLEFGAEAGNGDSFPGNPRNRNGAGAVAFYAHTGGDVGASHSWRAGLSYLETRAQDRTWSETDRAGANAAVGFTGTSHVAIADFVWKYAPNGNAHDTNFKVQGEYFWRRERGDLTFDRDGALGLTQSAPYGSTQQGYYVQGVWQFMPEWRVGARYDRLDPGSVDYGANAAYLDASTFHPQRASIMFDWTPSEFSRFRIQLAQSRVRPDVTDNQLFLQYILTLGAHGAHRF
jgi:hypothetical protein